MGVLFEMTIVGEYARLSASDEDTGTEVVVFGPAHGARSELEVIALRKLEKKLQAPARPKRRGDLV
jgi:hypothetical protein